MPDSTAIPQVGGALPAPHTMLVPIASLPPDYCIAVGHIASKWTWLENQLAVLSRVGLKLDKKEQRILMGGQPMKVRAAILRIVALKWITAPALRDDLRKLAKDCIGQTNNRNDFVHGFWVHPEGEPNNIGLQIMDSGEDRYMPRFRPVPLTELQAVVIGLNDLQVRAQRLTERIKGKPPKPA